MASIFISYATADRSFVVRLANSLTQLGHSIWVDTQGIGVGDTIPERIADAAETADFVVVVLSRKSTTSSWSATEWQAKLWDEIVSRQTRVLPVVLEDCEIPFLLRPKRHADFRSDYALGLAQLAIVLHQNVLVLPSNDHVLTLENTEVRPDRIITLQSPVSQVASLCYDDLAMRHFGRMVEVDVQLEIPYIGRIGGVWKPDEREQDAAWELYVELSTRISVAELSPSDGLLRESLTSLYGIFTTTREILRKYGPAVARPKGDSQLSFGYIAISILNYGLRPVLAKWHPLLLDYEHHRDANLSQHMHEDRWEMASELRHALSEVRSVLVEYTRLLAQISRVPAMDNIEPFRLA